MTVTQHYTHKIIEQLSAAFLAAHRSRLDIRDSQSVADSVEHLLDMYFLDRLDELEKQVDEVIAGDPPAKDVAEAKARSGKANMKAGKANMKVPEERVVVEFPGTDLGMTTFKEKL